MAEVMLHNALDPDFRRMLRPLHLMQTVLFQPKYRVLHGFVTPNGALAHLHCSLGVLVVLAVNVGRYWTQMHVYAHRRTALMTSILIFDSIFYTAYSAIICAVNLSQSNNNVNLILKMQQVHRLLDCSEELRMHRLNNWANIVVALILFAMFMSFNFIQDASDYSQLLLVMTLFYFDSNVIFALQVARLLERALRRWLRVLARFRETCAPIDHDELIKYLSQVDAEEHKLYQAYLDILDAFKLYRSIFQYSILLLAVEVFVHPLVYIQSFLERDKVSDSVDDFVLSRLTAALWAVKNFLLLALVSAGGARLRLAVRDVDAASAVLRAEPSCLVNIKKLCKKVWRLNAARRAGAGCAGGAGGAGGAGAGAGGAPAADAALPLRLLALLATYTVVLLQFAFL